MTNNNREDHPVTAMLSEVSDAGFGPEVKALVIRLSAVCDKADLYNWWDGKIGQIEDRGIVLKMAIDRYNHLNSINSSGWQLADVYVQTVES